MRSRHLTILMLAAAASLLAAASVARAAATPEQQCQAAKNKAAGKYAACRQSAEAKLATTGDVAGHGAALAVCATKFTREWQRAIDRAAAAGAACRDAPLTAGDFQTVLDEHTDAIAAALGGGGLSSCAITSTTTSSTTTTTAPGLCGNGIIEGGEWCDGDELCESNCTIRRFACCEFATPSGETCSAAVPAFTLLANQAQVCGLYGGTFRLGLVAAAGETCAEPAPGYGYPEQAGACVPPPHLAAPATVCCQESPSSCGEITTASQEAITDFVWACLYSHYPNAPVVAGTCGAEGQCVPAH